MTHVPDASETDEDVRMRQLASGPFIEIQNEASDGLPLRKEADNVSVWEGGGER